MEEKPTPTPKKLRAQAERAIWLATGLIDEAAKAALLVYAQELLHQAAQIEADPN